MQPNKLGWITSMTYGVDREMIDVTSYGEKQNFIVGKSLIRGSIDFVASDGGALIEFMQDLQQGRVSEPVYQKEYQCLYCGSPNKVEHTHCKKCGAPRSFLIG